LERSSVWKLVAVLATLIAAAACLWLMPMQLGLDLQGGVHVVMQARPTDDTPVTRDVMERALTVIERRVNALGISESIVQIQGADRIAIQLPGVTDHEQAIETIGRTALLEFQDPFGNTVLTGSNLRNAQVTQDQFGAWAIEIEFDAHGTQVFAQLTRDWVGTNMPLPIVFDGEVVVAPVVEAVITDGKGIISGRFTREEAGEVALLLRSGALPVPLEVLEIRNVGPTLGQESIDQSLRAGIIGLILVVIYILVFYRSPGLLADVALGIYVVLVLGALVAMRAVLTLPGIAGFILSIGMAVDANVLIYERVREELGQGKRLQAAIHHGWKNAFRAILDANLTSLITAAILFYFGSGPVRGFAVTLSVGIVLSMFTAIVVTRLLVELAMQLSPDRLAKSFGAKAEARTRRFVFTPQLGTGLWALVIAASLAVWALAGMNLGIDFTGGTLLERGFQGEVSAEQVRGVLAAASGIDAGSAVIQPVSGAERAGETVMQIRTGELTNAQIAELDSLLAAEFGAVSNRLTEVVGPVVGGELVRNALWALGLSAVAVLAYLAFRFEYRFGIAAVLGVTHDVLFVLAFLALTRTQINMPFIAAILTVVGYSLNNTIVIFDRIRESLSFRKKESLLEIVNKSVTQTLGRTIHTALTTLLVLFALLFLGGATLQDFVLTLIVGIVVGTLCSLFFAPAIWLTLQRERPRTEEQAAATQG
jgi:SecD/SecF fusion protein